MSKKKACDKLKKKCVKQRGGEECRAKIKIPDGTDVKCPDPNDRKAILELKRETHRT